MESSHAFPGSYRDILLSVASGHAWFHMLKFHFPWQQNCRSGFHRVEMQKYPVLNFEKHFIIQMKMENA